MPGYDGTGPQGYGPMTGGGRGNCAGAGLGRLRGRGMGRGLGRGLGRGFRGGRGPVNADDAGIMGTYSDQEKLLVLRQEAQALKNEMNQMQKLIDSLEEKLNNKE